MKKNVLFLILMLAVAVLLFLLRKTGMTAHIIVSVVGLVILAAYTIATKKDWKSPLLEILMRAFYGIALITGVVLMNVHDIAAISIIHKISAALFAIVLIICEVNKLVKKL